MATYFQGARPGYMKLYHTPEDSFWCCTGTGMENHVKYRDSIYFHDNDALYVNLFVPSSVAWKEKGAVLTQTTTFPESPTTMLRWTMQRPAELTLKLRHPRWSRTATVLVNGAEAARSNNPGSYVELVRTWRSGDEVELRLVMEVSAERAPAAPDIVAFTYGPLVLAGDFGRDGLAPGADIVVNEREYGTYNDAPLHPACACGRSASRSPRRSGRRAGRWNLRSLGRARAGAADPLLIASRTSDMPPIGRSPRPRADIQASWAPLPVRLGHPARLMSSKGSDRE